MPDRGLSGYDPAPTGVRPRTEEPGQLLLRSKLQAPRVPSRHIERQRLLELLRGGREDRLTLVCAPPGYGKTALLAQWHEREAPGRPFAWLSLDREDSDPARLWAHLIWAIGETAPELRDPLPMRVEIVPDNLVAGVLPLLLEAISTLPGERVIVLDDYHLVDSELCDRSLEFFLDHLPPQVQLVVASRFAPRLPLGRLRAHGQLLELGVEELRLSEPEAAAVAEAVVGAPLAEADVHELVERTEGWPAGVHLASLRLRHSQQPAAVIESVTGDTRYVFDFLEHDLIDGLSDEMRSFLRRTSVLSRFSAPVCDAVCDWTASRRLLEKAESANLFLVPLDDRREWFRYHQLFADALRRDLEDTEPELVPELHTRASLWFDEAGEAGEAIAHAISAHDVPRASDLITRHAASVIRAGGVTTVQGWADQLLWPNAVADAQLAVTRAMVLGILDEPAKGIERWLEVAECGSRDGPLANGMPSLEFAVALIRSLYVLGDVTRAAQAGKRAFDLAPKGSTWRLEALLARGRTLYLSGRAAAARPVLEQAVLEASPDAPQTMAGVYACLALIELDSGEFDRGEALARRSLAVLDERGMADLAAAAGGHLALGVALGARGALAEAEAEIERGELLRSRSAPSVGHSYALVLRARTRLARGELAGAREAADAARLEVESLRDVGIVSPLLEDTELRLKTGARRPVEAGEDLSERELVILRLLAAGLTKPEIARELYIAYNTVKSHTRTIYRKLDASTREEAVERARTLRLL